MSIMWGSVLWILGSFCWCLAFSWGFHGFEQNASLKLSNDGPVYFRSPITFTAELITDQQNYREYHYYFESEWPAELDYKLTSGERKVQITHTFDIPKEKAQGEFLLFVRVSYTEFFIKRTVARARMKFSLSNKIPASLILVQNGTTLGVDPNPEGKTLVSSAINVTASCAINDPAGYFANRNMTFTNYWKLNNGIGNYNISMSYRFPSQPGKEFDFLQVFIAAFDPNGTQMAEGVLSQNIVALNPVSYLNRTGDLFSPRGSIIKLNFSCDASPPIYYCFDPVNVPSPANTTDFNCTSQVHRFETCSFGAVHYFGEVGDHEIRVLVYNEVNKFLHIEPWRKIYSIHIYEVESKGLLGLFIVPISCIIFGFVVVVAGVAFYKHTKGDIRVEVADFDFGGASNSFDFDDPVQAAMLEERTFWTHLRDELAESSPLFSWLVRRPKRLTTLSLIDDDLPDSENAPGTMADQNRSRDVVGPSSSSSSSSKKNNINSESVTSIESLNTNGDTCIASNRR